MQHVRTVLFYFCLACTALVFGLLSVFTWPTPYAFRSRVLIGFNIITLWCLRITCGIRVQIKGEEHIPTDTPVVIMAKHQSTWEAFFLQSFFHPTSTILKRELLRIPFFGWGLAQLRPIAIDRSNPKQALKKVKTFGSKRLDEGNNVLVFPEGTRTPVGKTGKYARSGADIALTHQYPVIPVAHNAGVYWPMGTWLKYPGCIELAIGKPIDTHGLSSKEITKAVENWIENEVEKMPSKPAG